MQTKEQKEPIAKKNKTEKMPLLSSGGIIVDDLGVVSDDHIDGMDDSRNEEKKSQYEVHASNRGTSLMQDDGQWLNMVINLVILVILTGQMRAKRMRSTLHILEKNGAGY